MTRTDVALRAPSTDVATMKVEARTILAGVIDRRFRNRMDKELLKVWDLEHGRWILRQIRDQVRSEEELVREKVAKQLARAEAFHRSRGRYVASGTRSF